MNIPPFPVYQKICWSTKWDYNHFSYMFNFFSQRYLMKEPGSITHFIVAHHPVSLLTDRKNDQSIAAASFSKNSSNKVCEKPYQPDQTYCFSKRSFRKRLQPIHSTWFTSYSLLHYQSEIEVIICYICVKQNHKGNLSLISNKLGIQVLSGKVIFDVDQEVVF